MKKSYIFILLLGVFLYLIYLLGVFKYHEYKVNTTLSELEHNNKLLAENIHLQQEILGYKSTRAYKNKVLKSEQGLISKGERVIYLIDEATYQKYTQEKNTVVSKVAEPQKSEEEKLIESMNNSQKWIYLFTKKDIR